MRRGHCQPTRVNHAGAGGGTPPTPGLERTWQFQVNVPIAAQASALATSRLTMRSMKNSYLGTGAWTDSEGNPTASTNNWTCIGSCNAVAFGLDGVDRWATDADLVWAAAGTNHSWIVLEQAGIPGAPNPFQLCYDLSNGNPNQGSLIISPGAGFTGGAINARPTATDELLVINNTVWGISLGNAAQVIHTMKSVDGKSTRFFIARNGFACGAHWFEEPLNTVAGWTNPSLGYSACSNSTTPGATTLTFSLMYSTPRAFGLGASGMAMSLTAEGFFTALLGDTQAYPNDLSGLYPLYPLGLNCVTAPNRGRHGTLADCYAPVDGQPDGCRYPDATQPPEGQWAQFGSIVVPWNRTPVNLGAAAAGSFPVYFPTLID